MLRSTAGWDELNHGLAWDPTGVTKRAQLIAPAETGVMKLAAV